MKFRLLLILLLAGPLLAQGIVRRHLDQTFQPPIWNCGAPSCSVTFEGNERHNAPCYVYLWCSGQEPCTVHNELLQWTLMPFNWGPPINWEYTIPADGLIGWEGVYPRAFRMYSDQTTGYLPWRITAVGLRAWEGYETVTGPDGLPTTQPLMPTKVEATP